MKRSTVTTIAALFCAAAASHAADLYLDLNGASAGFDVNTNNSPIEVNFTNLIWNTDSTGGAGGAITNVSDGDILHFGLEGGGGILFNWTYYTNATVGGIHTYQTAGSTANISRFQKTNSENSEFQTIQWAPGAFFDSEKECSLWWLLGTFGDFEKVGEKWLIFSDGGPKVNGTCTISQNNIIVKDLNTVDSNSSFKLNGGQFRIQGGLSGTANVGILSGSGKVRQDGAGNLWNIDVNSMGVNMTNGVATDLIDFDAGASFALNPSSVSDMEVTKMGATNYSDQIWVRWGSQTMTQAGTLNVELLPGSEPLADGDTFELFRINHAQNATMLGSFDTINLPDPGDPGLIWSSALLSSSGTISVVTADTNAPSAPTGLVAVSNIYTVSLDWDDNSELTVTGYKVYRSETSGSGFVEIADVGISEYTDTTTLADDITYYYQVSAYNFVPAEGDPSAEASTTVPFGLRNGDFELPALVSGGTTIDANGDWTQDGSQQGIQKSTWASEPEAVEEQGAWMKGWNKSATNSFYQDKATAAGIEYNLDAGFKVQDNFRANGGQVEMALVWLDGGSAEISRDSLDIDAAISTNAWAHTNIVATAPAGSAMVRALFHWTTTTNAGTGSGNQSCMVDNVTLTRDSAPSPYDVWAGGWGVDIGGPNDDFVDNDGMDNLLEYALDGNPTADDAGDKLPVFTVAEDGGSDWFYYVHNERTDDSSLAYAVKLKGNLAIDPEWVTNGVEFVDEVAITNNFKSVTNRTDIGDAEFIRLEVQQD
ncbi:hypothetical protein PDESU_01131 [Pontiella desulfatans]|uniref:Fibronectin type-III domain-containing protein n=1 Tax=Pontiella desulfatans TaxID=2750659 RepID=A0A6C2TXX2_PONDE|nr:fibronectin type III domain-containing protein [Pontiella desulfatans]VGO12578.1 hypothetical protein PDESU_01131 [Pontiella desulfatans]